MADADPKDRESTRYLTMGASIGLFGVVGALAGAAVCPVCVVATPALLGVGLYKRWQERGQAPGGAAPEGEGKPES